MIRTTLNVKEFVHSLHDRMTAYLKGFQIKGTEDMFLDSCSNNLFSPDALLNLENYSELIT